jgi:hypothetical protein
MSAGGPLTSVEGALRLEATGRAGERIVASSSCIIRGAAIVLEKPDKRATAGVELKAEQFQPTSSITSCR